MARFDVYTNPDALERRSVPFFLDVQSDHLGELDTRVVIPLYVADRFPIRVQRLNPVVDVADKSVVLDTASIGTIPMAELRRPVTNLGRYQLDIQDALDTLFGAY